MLPILARKLGNFCHSRPKPGKVCLAFATLLFATTTQSEAQQPRAPRRVADLETLATASVQLASHLGELGAVVDAVQRYGRVEKHREYPLTGLKLTHYMAGLQASIPVLQRSRLKLVGDFGFAATKLRSRERGIGPGLDTRIRETYFSLRGAIRIEYALNPDCDIYLAGQDYVYLDQSETTTVEALGGVIRPLQAGSWTFPVTLGVRMRFR